MNEIILLLLKAKLMFNNSFDGNTGLVSVSFPPLLTGVWVGIIILFKWAAIGETPGQFFMEGGSKLCYKIFYIP